MSRLAELLAAPDDDVVPLLCGLTDRERAPLGRDVDAMFAAVPRDLNAQDRHRLRLSRIATLSRTAAPVEVLPRTDEEMQREAVLDLVAAGYADRGRVLDATLAALALVQWPTARLGRITGDGVLRPLLAARATLPPAARVLVAAVLGSARLADRVAAADAVTDLVPHRLPAAGLGAAMAWLAPATPLQRWAWSLRAVAEAGRGTDVAAVLAALLPALERTMAGLFSLVELLADLALPVPEGELRQWLAGFTGTGKAARAARAALTSGH